MLPEAPMARMPGLNNGDSAMAAADERWLHKRVAMLAYPDANGLDVTGPLQLFASATRYMDRFLAVDDPATRVAYDTVLVAPAAGPVRISAGFEVMAHGIDDVLGDIDTLLVAGGDGQAEVVRQPAVLDWLRGMAPQVRRIGSVCTGAFVLAAAGLLDGRRATTHWRACDALAAAYPEIEVEPDALHVCDGGVYTSAGVTAGMDLALALIEEDCGRRIALATAREVVMFLKRPGGQSQFSAHLAAQAAQETPIGAVQAWIVDHPDVDLSVETLAARAAMSPRNFARVFARQTGTTPAKFVEGARVDAARRALEHSGDGLPAVAAACGFGHVETMRRVFHRHLGISPQDYRRRFAAAPAALAS